MADNNGMNVSSKTIDNAISVIETAIKSIDSRNQKLAQFHANFPWDDDIGDKCRKQIWDLALDANDVAINLNDTIKKLTQLKEIIEEMNGLFKEN